jgi:hypothetical protein
MDTGDGGRRECGAASGERRKAERSLLVEQFMIRRVPSKIRTSVGQTAFHPVRALSF